MARKEHMKSYGEALHGVLCLDAFQNILLGRYRLSARALTRARETNSLDPMPPLLAGILFKTVSENEADPVKSASFKKVARDAFSEAIRLDAESPWPHRELGSMELRDGNLALACQELVRAVRLEQDPSEPIFSFSTN